MADRSESEADPKRVVDPSMPDFAPSEFRKRGGGGKLSRSETVTVRLDPKLRYPAELAARKQRRTLSSFIEWAIEENLKQIYLEERLDALSIASESADLWDEADRFAKLAFRYPQMLTLTNRCFGSSFERMDIFGRASTTERASGLGKCARTLSFLNVRDFNFSQNHFSLR